VKVQLWDKSVVILGTFGTAKLSSPLKPQKKKLGQPKSMSSLLYVKAQHVLNNYNLEWFNVRLHPQQ
jgi:hypothetical protein